MPLLSHHLCHMLLKLLNSSQNSTSFVFATHDEKIMGYLRRIINLEDGEIVKDEKIDEPQFGEK